jgi:hypothetical protein
MAQPLGAGHDRRDQPLTMSGKMESVMRKLQKWPTCEGGLSCLTDSSPHRPCITQPLSLCIQAEVGGYNVARCDGTGRLVDVCTGWYAASEEEEEEGSEELPTAAAAEPK